MAGGAPPTLNLLQPPTRSLTRGSAFPPENNSGITFKLQLNCHARNTTELRSLQMSSLPRTAMAIKKAIQEQFSIPVCIQTVSYQHYVLANDDNMRGLYHHMRNDDILTVDYLCEADIPVITEILNWINSVNTVLLSQERMFPTPLTMQAVHAAVLPATTQGYQDTMALNIFGWLDIRTMVNKMYFKESEAINCLLELYKAVMELRWRQVPEAYSYLESFCVQVLAQFAETMEYRRYLYQWNGFDLALESILRMRLEFPDVHAYLDSDNPNDAQGIALTTNILEHSLLALSNFAELPECQQAMASHCPLMRQIFNMSLSDFFGIEVATQAAEILVYLASNCNTHPHLTTTYSFMALTAIYNVFEDSMRADVLPALKCYLLMVFAQIAILSPNLLPSYIMNALIPALRGFLTSFTPYQIIHYEDTTRRRCSTIFPYLRLLYFPEDTPPAVLLSEHQELTSDSIDINEEAHSSWYYDNYGIFHVVISRPEVEQRMHENHLSAAYLVRKLSVELALFFLHAKVARPCHAMVVAEEGLEDYLVCLPWHVEPSCRRRAQDLVTDLSLYLRLQPPRMGGVVRAALAKAHFGLERMASKSLRQLLQTILQEPALRPRE